MKDVFSILFLDEMMERRKGDSLSPAISLSTSAPDILIHIHTFIARFITRDMRVETEHSRNGHRAYSDRKYDDRFRRKTYR